MNQVSNTVAERLQVGNVCVACESVRGHVLFCSAVAGACGPSVPHFSSSWETIGRATSQTGTLAADVLSGFISFAKRNQMSAKKQQRTFRELTEQGGERKNSQDAVLFGQVLQLRLDLESTVV